MRTARGGRVAPAAARDRCRSTHRSLRRCRGTRSRRPRTRPAGCVACGDCPVRLIRAARCARGAPRRRVGDTGRARSARCRMRAARRGCRKVPGRSSEFRSGKKTRAQKNPRSAGFRGRTTGFRSLSYRQPATMRDRATTNDGYWTKTCGSCRVAFLDAMDRTPRSSRREWTLAAPMCAMQATNARNPAAGTGFRRDAAGFVPRPGQKHRG